MLFPYHSEQGRILPRRYSEYYCNKETLFYTKRTHTKIFEFGTILWVEHVSIYQYSDLTPFTIPSGNFCGIFSMIERLGGTSILLLQEQYGESGRRHSYKTFHN